MNTNVKITLPVGNDMVELEIPVSEYVDYVCNLMSVDEGSTPEARSAVRKAIRAVIAEFDLYAEIEGDRDFRKHIIDEYWKPED